MAQAFGNTLRRDLGPLLPDPEPAARHYTLVSVDDHLVEPGNLFVDRMPKHLADIVPRIVPTDDGAESWLIDGELVPNRLAFTSIVGRPVEDWDESPIRLDELRPGSYDVDERVRDMDLAGIAASLCFPSSTFGFAGTRFHKISDPILGYACVRAYNDWIHEEWVGCHPDRFIPQQVTWHPDPNLAAAEVRRNAERGFKAVSFSENPEKLGFPSLYSDHWEPFFTACEETATVVNLHIGSSEWVVATESLSTDCPADVPAALFGMNALMAAVDWVYSGVANRHPDLKIVLSESGIDWIPYVLKRLDRHAYQSTVTGSWDGRGLTPRETFQRNFYFTSIEDSIGLDLREMIGLDKIMLECDYPHPDTQWPDIQETTRQQLGHLPHSDVERITHLNACDVYRHQLPESLIIAPQRTGS